MHKGQDAGAYNQNQDRLAVEFVRRWYDLWRERPGTGRRVNSGGAKIVFPIRRLMDVVPRIIAGAVWWIR